MKRALVSLILLGTLVALAGQALAAGAYVYLGMYWIAGTAAPGADSVDPNGRKVVFYKDDPAAGYVFDYVGPAGLAGQSNKFMLNAYGDSRLAVAPGYYRVAIVRGSDGYGAGPVTMEVTGKGYDVIGEPLVMAMGAGIADPSPVSVPTEPAPKIRLWFGSRLYQENIYWVKEKGDRAFVVTEKPDVKVELSIDTPYNLAANVDAHSIVIDEGTATAKTLALAPTNVTARTYAVGTAAEDGRVTAMSLSYTVDEPLASGKHTFTVSARSSGAMGTAALATQLATVEVMGGPLRLIGTPLCYPSPFSITKNRTVTIQYELSRNGNVDVYLIGVSGQRIKHWVFNEGTEGGSAGLNKFTWDGSTDQGYLAGNAIYVGTIVARDENRLLGKLKLTIVD